MLANLQFLFARQIPLYSFDGKKYQIEVEWAKERVAIDDMPIVELTNVSPNKTDPKSAATSVTQTIKELENSQEVDTLAENRLLDSELGPVLFFLMRESRGIES
jgi:hypothetical protein